MKQITDYAGIDYGMGHSNVDHATGIRYGVISQGSVVEAWYESAEPDYGEASCPKCGEKAEEYNEEKHGEYPALQHYNDCADYACERCAHVFESEHAFPEEPHDWNYQDSEYTLTDCLNTDILILKSPYYTYAQYCSPCVPGAGNLDTPCNNGPRTYCLGHDWFESGIAPYTVYSVVTNEIINPDVR